MTEQWAPIPNHPGYEASDLGRIRSLDREVAIIQSRWGRAYVRPLKGKVLAPASQGAYQVVSLSGRTRLVHALVLEAFVGPCPEGQEARHRNGNSTENLLVNLTWGTKSENQHDRVLHGTHPQARRTACPADHKLVGPNLDPHELRRGRRRCRSCKHARQHVRRHPEADFRITADAKYVEIMDGAQVA